MLDASFFVPDVATRFVAALFFCAHGSAAASLAGGLKRGRPCTLFRPVIRPTGRPPQVLQLFAPEGHVRRGALILRGRCHGHMSESSIYKIVQSLPWVEYFMPSLHVRHNLICPDFATQIVSANFLLHVRECCARRYEGLGRRRRIRCFNSWTAVCRVILYLYIFNIFLMDSLHHVIIP